MVCGRSTTQMKKATGTTFSTGNYYSSYLERLMVEFISNVLLNCFIYYFLYIHLFFIHLRKRDYTRPVNFIGSSTAGEEKSGDEDSDENQV